MLAGAAFQVLGVEALCTNHPPCPHKICGGPQPLCVVQADQAKQEDGEGDTHPEKRF